MRREEREVEVKELELELKRLSKFLSRKWSEVRSSNGSGREVIRIRDLPGLILNEEEFKKMILRGKMEEAGKISKRFRENLREIKNLRQEIVKRIPSQEVVEKLDRSLTSQLSLASEILKIAPRIKNVLSLLKKEESLERSLVQIRKKFFEEEKNDDR